MYIKRHLESEVLKASKNYPFARVCGQKQVEQGIILCMSDELVAYSKNAWLCPIALI